MLISKGLGGFVKESPPYLFATAMVFSFILNSRPDAFKFQCLCKEMGLTHLFSSWTTCFYFLAGVSLLFCTSWIVCRNSWTWIDFIQAFIRVIITLITVKGMWFAGWIADFISPMALFQLSILATSNFLKFVCQWLHALGWKDNMLNY